MGMVLITLHRYQPIPASAPGQDFLTIWEKFKIFKNLLLIVVLDFSFIDLVKYNTVEIENNQQRTISFH